MKKYLFLFIALCYAVVANAQGTDQFSAILQHGDQCSFYTGSTAFQKAYEAAVDGDVIILSEGTFQPVSRIEKSLSIYGAGFENNPETNTAVTAISGDQIVGKSSGETLDGFHIEGVRFMDWLMFDSSELKNATIQKCYINGSIRFARNIENVVVKQCRIVDSVLGYNTEIVANGLLVANCVFGTNVRQFSGKSFIHVDHCTLIRYSGEDYAQILFTNSIILGDSHYKATGVGQYCTVRNCIQQSNTGTFPENTLYDPATLYKLDLANIFADGEDYTYSPSRTYELKDPDTYKGTDGTPIGPSGGDGWNKVPFKPVVANLNTTVTDTNLIVTYDAVVK